MLLLCILLADPSSAETVGISPSHRLSKMASALQKCTLLGRITPILTVGHYFGASHPANGTLVTAVWWCITFWNIFDEFTAQDSSSLVAYVQVRVTNTDHVEFAFVPACVCVCNTYCVYASFCVCCITCTGPWTWNDCICANTLLCTWVWIWLHKKVCRSYCSIYLRIAANCHCLHTQDHTKSMTRLRSSVAVDRAVIPCGTGHTYMYISVFITLHEWNGRQCLVLPRQPLPSALRLLHTSSNTEGSGWAMLHTE